MKVVLVSNSDMKGGAAVVTYRLMDALCKLGADAAMLVVHKYSNDSRVHVLGNSLARKAKFVAERGCIYSHNGFNRHDLFKVSIANTGFDLSKHALVRDADAVLLSWVNQGVVSLNGVDKLLSTGKRVLWFMHDMWCMTGACHHAMDCRGYTAECGNCRYFKRGRFEYDKSREGHDIKRRLYGKWPRLTFVAVSKWLADCARRSSLLSGCDVRVINNAFPIERFYLQPRGDCQLPEGIDGDKRLIVMGAARLDDPIKNIDLAIDSLNRLLTERPDIESQCQAVFYGEIRDRAVFSRLKFNYVYVGTISEQGVLNELFAMSAVVMSTSRFETLPGTLIEGMASGCTPVCTGNGGQRDIVDDGVTGYIVKDCPEDVAMALAKAIENPFDRNMLRSVVEERFDSMSIARKIVSVVTEFV